MAQPDGYGLVCPRTRRRDAREEHDAQELKRPDLPGQDLIPEDAVSLDVHVERGDRVG
jgi:hypothetical protein